MYLGIWNGQIDYWTHRWRVFIWVPDGLWWRQRGFEESFVTLRGDDFIQNALTWSTITYFQTKLRETNQVCKIHGRTHKTRSYAAPFHTPSQEINKGRDRNGNTIRRQHRHRKWNLAVFATIFPFRARFVDRRRVTQTCAWEAKRTDKLCDIERKSRGEHKKWTSLSSNLLNILLLPTTSEINSTVTKKQKVWKDKRGEPELPELQTVIKKGAQALTYRTCSLANKLSKYEEIISRYVATLVKNVKFQVKAQSFGNKDPVSVIDFLAIFRFSCDNNRIHQDAAVWVIPSDVYETQANALNRFISAEGKSTSITATFLNNDARSRKLLRSFPEVLNNNSKKFATDQAIAELDVAILRFMQPSYMTCQQHADDLVA